MSSANREAEKKFWQMPDLVETLLAFLDACAVSRLSQLHPLTVEILQGRLEETHVEELLGGARCG